MCRVPRRIVALALVFPLSLAVGSCGGGGSAGPAAPPSDSVTDTSGDFAITVHPDSATQITVSWENPAAKYAQTPVSIYSTVYGSAGKIVPSTSAFHYTSTGLMPETTYCYRAEVTAVYQYFFPYSSTTVGWSSGTACVTTPYGLGVLSTSPGSGDASIPGDPVISVTFNGTIDSKSITSDSFVVSGPSGVLTGNLAVSGATVAFTPDNEVLFNIPYTAAVSTAVKDTAGNSLTSGYQWTFTRRLALDNLLGVWGSSGSDVFVVGRGGTILHYDGDRWTATASGTDNDLYGVWGSSGSDVYAVGSGGTILHYDGTRWAVTASGTDNDLYGVWGNSDNNVFAVGSYGTIMHYDGSRWAAMGSGTRDWLRGVWGSSGDNVFAVGSYGTILHCDGSRWRTIFSGGADHFAGVWGTSGNDVFAAGGDTFRRYTVLLHYDGHDWWNVQGTTGTDDYYGIWGSSSSDVFVLSVNYIAHYDGTRWGGFGMQGIFRGIWGSSGTDVFAVGDRGAIVHYDGSTWKSMP